MTLVLEEGRGENRHGNGVGGDRKMAAAFERDIVLRRVVTAWFRVVVLARDALAWHRV